MSLSGSSFLDFYLVNMIFINFKTFEESSGDRGLALLNIIGDVSTQTEVSLIPVVQPLDLALFSGKTLLKLWVQHIDPISFGAHTGAILPEEVIRLQGKGTFLNHSEHQILFRDLQSSVARAREVGLKTLVFAKDILVLQRVLKLRPDFVSYEPPELVGSTTTSVSQAKPEVIYEAGEMCRIAGIPLIVGAGIHSTEDVQVALQGGAQGIAVATDIVKSTDPKSALLSLVRGFNK